MKILFVSSEAFPLIKTGGLADVSGSLPAALRELGADVRLLIPGYPAVVEKLLNQQTLIELKQLPMIGNATLLMGEMPDTGIPVMAISCPSLYLREGGPYLDANGQDWIDNPLRFGILSYVAALLSNADSPLAQWIPDIVHCNDWQSGLTPAYMHYMGAERTEMHQAKSVFGIHNLAFQGNYPATWVNHLRLPAASYQIDGLEFYDQMSFLKAGIHYADSIVTVSPTYAQEIQTEEYGCGMQDLLELRSKNIHGILNGIDTDEWNPAKDPYLPKPYDAENLTAKKATKRALQKDLGLTQDIGAPMLGVVSRLTDQKGLDLFLACAEPLLVQSCQIVLLGGGDPALEQGFKQLAEAYPSQVSVTIGYNEPFSHQIMAGADMFIMPSRFEPCGLNQMYGLRYGTPPVVRRTGGLADSVQDTNATTLENGTATGFVFTLSGQIALLTCIQRALTYYQDKEAWQRIQRNGMSRNLGWDQSAKTYLKVYNALLS